MAADGGGSGRRGANAPGTPAETGWTRVIDEGDATRARVDLSKDNVFFEARSIDEHSRRSPAAFPMPQA